jgi:putative membrane protein
VLRDEHGDSFMITRITSLVSASALALATLNCGGGSTPSSNTPNTAPLESTVPPSTDPQDTSAVSGAASESPTPGAPLTDAQIAAVTDAVNTAEIEQAQLAQSKSTNAQVQSFASMMIEHHGQAKRKQTTLGIAEAESALSLKLAAETRTTLEQLEQKSGSEFDRAYLQAQIDGHQKVLNAIDQQLLPDAKNEQLKSYLEELRPQVAAHLERARTAKDALASNDGSSPVRAAQQ